MEQLSRSFRLQQGSSSFKIGRSNSSLLVSESISTECARDTNYERLSESMRLGNEYVLDKSRSKKKRALGILTKVLNFRKDSVNVEAKQPKEAKHDKKMKDVKRLSKWLPDPERRWPVQGWWCHKAQGQGQMCKYIVNLILN